MPFVTVLIAKQQNIASRALVSTAIGIALTVMVYSLYKTMRGHWVHMDASVPEERHQLNLFLATFLLTGAGVAWWFEQSDILYLALIAMGGLMTISLLLRLWLKLSLHVSFAVFATMLLWPNWQLIFGGLLFSAVIAWSRLVLSRHSTLDVFIGALLGSIIGGAYMFIIAL